ncbi:MAG TPA: hypothetical protein VEC57_10700 [Candidatus Limnocylindrales bacterium]|nr:hypothetical protein [Candidatus Limnocylindrales bacterium]
MNVNAYRIRRFAVAALCAVVLSACGVPHVRVELPLYEEGYYDRAAIEAVHVESVERHRRAHELNEKFARMAGRLLHRELSRRFELIEPRQGRASRTLVVAVDIHIQYGSRAARYLVGGGAGAGYVDSVLTAVDAETGQEQLRVSARSELAVGVFGGSMDEAVTRNIRALIRKSGLAS